MEAIDQIKLVDKKAHEAIKVLENLMAKADNEEDKEKVANALIGIGVLLRDNKNMIKLLEDNPNLIKSNTDDTQSDK